MKEYEREGTENGLMLSVWGIVKMMLGVKGKDIVLGTVY